MSRPLTPLPSATTVTDGGAAAAPLLPVAAAALTPGTRVRMHFGWPLLEQHVDGVVMGYRDGTIASVKFEDEDCNRLVEVSRLTLAPPRNDGFGDDE